jgi:deazaflavin-dependent oxidoreductase (nitroreductase family)
MSLKKRVHKGIGIVLKHTLNPFTRRLARTSFGPFSLIQHVGRRSGRLYETPIVAVRTEDGFIIELTYGPEVDWYQNVQAAGGCTVIWRGKPYGINQFEPLDTETGMMAFPLAARLILRALRRRHFVKLFVEPGNPGGKNAPVGTVGAAS